MSGNRYVCWEYDTADSDQDVVADTAEEAAFSYAAFVLCLDRDETATVGVRDAKWYAEKNPSAPEYFHVTNRYLVEKAMVVG